MRLSDRPTSDLVVIFLAGLVGVVIATLTITAAVVAISSRDQPTDAEVNALRDVVSTMLGAIIGYIGGRHIPRRSNDE